MKIPFRQGAQYVQLMRLNKPIGIFLLLWPTLWALWVAGAGHPSPSLILIFTLGALLTRSAGVIVNDWADRHFDGSVKRTLHRPLATEAVTSKEALFLALLLGLLAAGLLLFMNLLTTLLALIAAALAVVYPFCKRVTHFPQCVLGLAFGSSVPMAFAAQTGTVPALGWYLFVIAVLWPVTYDTLYAMADREDDKKLGLKSTALWLGPYDCLGVGILQATVLTLLFFLGYWLFLGWLYYICLAIAVGLAMSMLYLARARSPDQCLKAFLINNALGAVIFIGIVLGFWQ